MSRTDNLIHLEVLSTGEHRYFGSLEAIYDEFTAKQIGCKVKNLWNYGIEPGRPYKNKKVIIRKGVIHRKPNKKKKD